MARIPTTEFCEECANSTPKEVLAKSGRAQVRVYQNLDTGLYECAAGHKVDLGPLAESSMPEQVTHFHPDNDTSRAPIASHDDTERIGAGAAVAVEEIPQSNQTQIVPGSSVIKQGGSMEMVLVIPEQYVGALRSYCDGIGKSVEEFVNEVIASGFENGWFV